jgi:hypothetical protein
MLNIYKQMEKTKWHRIKYLISQQIIYLKIIRFQNVISLQSEIYFYHDKL